MCDQTRSLVLPASRPWHSVLHGIWQSLDVRGSRLDPDTLSEHLKRDLGLSAGRVSVPRDSMRD
jgi:hypothetical protein